MSLEQNLKWLEANKFKIYHRLGHVVLIASNNKPFLVPIPQLELFIRLLLENGDLSIFEAEAYIPTSSAAATRSMGSMSRRRWEWR